MGLYINPENQTREQFLIKEGVFIGDKNLPTWEELRKEFPNDLPVCLVDNVAFTAAAIIYSKLEMMEFQCTNSLPKRWFLVPISKLIEQLPQLPQFIED